MIQKGQHQCYFQPQDKHDCSHVQSSHCWRNCLRCIKLVADPEDGGGGLQGAMTPAPVKSVWSIAPLALNIYLYVKNEHMNDTADWLASLVSSCFGDLDSEDLLPSSWSWIHRREACSDGITITLIITARIRRMGKVMFSVCLYPSPRFFLEGYPSLRLFSRSFPGGGVVPQSWSGWVTPLPQPGQDGVPPWPG